MPHFLASLPGLDCQSDPEDRRQTTFKRAAELIENQIQGTIMFLYVDESGHTGSELFDANQPILYYGVTSSDVNLDVLAEERLVPLRKRLGVDRLHAAQLGVGRLVTIADELVS